VSNELTVSDNDIKSKIVVIRDKPMLLDRDVADLYEVKTKDINQAVRRNADKFPERYLYRLNNDEKNGLITNCDKSKWRITPVNPRRSPSKVFICWQRY
jgi:hypothetical protein